MTSAAMEVPSTIDGIDAQWLTAVLRADGVLPASANVTTVRAEQIAMDTGFSSLLYRLHIAGDRGVPQSLIAKLPAQSDARGAMEMLGGYAREVTFYQHVAGRAPMGTPRAYAAETATESTDFVLLLEDLCDWDNADHLAGLTLGQARKCIAELAGLHAWSADPANSGVVAAFPSMDTPMTREVLPSVFPAGWRVYREKSQHPVSAAVAGYAEKFAGHAPMALRALTERATLVHGDIRADNMFFADDQLKIVDFQLAARGAGAADIGYLVSQGLPTATRAGRDEELLGEYLDLLSQHGVDDYAFDAAWRHYRFATAYLMVLPVIILGGWDHLAERSRQLCLTLTDRAVATIEEIKAWEVFE